MDVAPHPKGFEAVSIHYGRMIMKLVQTMLLLVTCGCGEGLGKRIEDNLRKMGRETHERSGSTDSRN